MKKAIIIGSEGQDGSLLFQLLKKENYSIIGIGKNSTKSGNGALEYVVDISKKNQVSDLVRDFRPDEVYYLAAVHQSSENNTSEDVDFFKKSYDVNVFYLSYFLDAIKTTSTSTKIFYASSSHIFGDPESEIQDENTPFNPDSIYGITKLDGLLTCRLYRRKYGVFACSGILYNHESGLRKDTFFSKKLIKGAIEIKNGKRDKIVLGDLSAVVDWGYAPDYVNAMHGILSLNVPDDFVIATGKKHSVEDFVRIAFQLLNLDWKRYIFVDNSVLTRQRKTLIGDPKKLIKATNWRPSVDFKGMIKKLLTEQGAAINE
jgi:GDPmannose 4,6-dehydratase